MGFLKVFSKEALFDANDARRLRNEQIDTFRAVQPILENIKVKAAAREFELYIERIEDSIADDVRTKLKELGYEVWHNRNNMSMRIKW